MGDRDQRTARHQLAARRKKAGYSQERLAAVLEITPASYCRWERGQANPRARHRARLAEALNLTMDELDLLLDNELEERSWPDITGHKVPFWLNLYASFEHGAARIDAVEPLLIPGLLQTRAYATAIVRDHFEPLSEREIEERVGFRLARQRVLERKVNPVVYRCIVDESALYRVADSPKTMAHQLDRLVELTARPNIEIRIMPARCATGGSITNGGFTLFYAEGADRPYVVSTDNLMYLSQHQDHPDAIERHLKVVECLLTVTLSQEESVRAILRARGAPN